MKASKNDHRHRIAIVDDHAFVRLGLEGIIAQQPGMSVCGSAGNVVDALALLESAQPDLMLVDLSLQGASGLELIKQIELRRPDTKVLVLSMHDEGLYAERALRAGAKGYIHKGEPNAQLVAAIRTVLGGQIYLSERMTRLLLERTFRREDKPEIMLVDLLSDRELEVFQHLGDGLSTHQIAGKLVLSSKTIESYREHIKFKLKLGTTSELVRTAVQWRLMQE